jgi:hypothetical protein
LQGLVKKIAKDLTTQSIKWLIKIKKNYVNWVYYKSNWLLNNIKLILY